jgi:hypothetical protein
LPDFSWYLVPKPEKCTKSTQNVPNVLKLFQMSLKYSKCPLNIPIFSNLRPSKIYSNWDFWFENKPSGNPAAQQILVMNATIGLAALSNGHPSASRLEDPGSRLARV